MKKANHNKWLTKLVALGCIIAIVFSLAACSGGAQPAATEGAEAAAETPAAADGFDYSDYIGYQFSGTDPWGGELAVTIRSIENGVMEATYTDVIDIYTFYSEMEGIPVDNEYAPFGASGTTLEDENTTFSYSGHMEFIGNGQIKVVYEGGETSTASDQGGSSAYHVEALDENAKTVILTKTVDPTANE